MITIISNCDKAVGTDAHIAPYIIRLNSYDKLLFTKKTQAPQCLRLSLKYYFFSGVTSSSANLRIVDIMMS